MEAKFSRDGGHSWGKPFVFRGDGRAAISAIRGRSSGPTARSSPSTTSKTRAASNGPSRQQSGMPATNADLGDLTARNCRGRLSPARGPSRPRERPWDLVSPRLCCGTEAPVIRQVALALATESAVEQQFRVDFDGPGSGGDRREIILRDSFSSRPPTLYCSFSPRWK